MHLDDNEIKEKGRNSIRESLIRTFRHKATSGKNRKKSDDYNDITNIEYDYNKIFALLYRKENDPYEKKDELNGVDLTKEKNINFSIDDFKGGISEKTNGKNSNINNINIAELTELNLNNKENNDISTRCTCRKINKFKRKDTHMKSFVTAISRENSEDFLMKKNENGQKDNKENTTDINDDEDSKIYGRKALIELEENKQNEELTFFEENGINKNPEKENSKQIREGNLKKKNLIRKEKEENLDEKVNIEI